MREIAVTFSAVTFGYPGVPLFDDFTWSATNRGRGSVVAVVGASGVGKTSFCELLLDLRKPLHGVVNRTPGDAKVCFIPQRAVLFEGMSIEQNIRCLRYSTTLGPTYTDEKAAAAAQALGLEPLKARAATVKSLSGGESQRVMLARVRTIDCDILVMDEPCSSLDNHLKDHFLRDLADLVRERALLVFFVTHSWREVEMVADQVLFLARDRGAIHAASTLGRRDAEASPPSLEALFTIFWPHCLRVDLGSFPVPPSLGPVPADARYLGVGPGPALSAEEADAQLGLAAWARERAGAEAGGGPIDGRPAAVWFFDDRGFLL